MRSSHEVRERVLFHVTEPTKVESIMRKGLAADDEGHIFALSDRRLADVIARDQLFLSEYALLSIDAYGITGDIEPDEVAEFSAKWHRVIVQLGIEPRFLRVVSPSVKTADFPSEGDYLIRTDHLGETREQADRYFAMRREADASYRDFLLACAAKLWMDAHGSNLVPDCADRSTINGNRITLRDADGEHLGEYVYGPERTSPEDFEVTRTETGDVMFVRAAD
jgi:hypothetical protein